MVRTSSRRNEGVGARLLAYLTACWLAYGSAVDGAVTRGVGMARALEAELPVDLSAEIETVGDRLVAAQTETIIAGIVIGAALLIGFFVIDSMYTAAGVHTVVDDPANSTFSADQNSTLDRIGDGLLIGGVVIIVLFAAIILRVLRGL